VTSISKISSLYLLQKFIESCIVNSSCGASSFPIINQNKFHRMLQRSFVLLLEKEKMEGKEK
jgi:hypothetical protein